MGDAYEVHKNVPIREGKSTAGHGLSGSIRQMAYGDSIIVPAALRISAHTCAKSVGAKVKTRSNDDGTVTIWKIDPAADSAVRSPAIATPTTLGYIPFKSAFEVTAPGPGNLPSGYYTMEAAGSTIWHEGPPPDAPPGYVPPAPAKPKPKYQPPTSTSIMPPDLAFTLDDVPYLGHRHSTFRSIEGTRAILNFHGCDSTAKGQVLPQPKLTALCFAFVLALGQDNHSSLLTDHPQLQPLFSSLGWKPEIVTIFSEPPASATKPFSMEELRTIFYKYADAHSMEKAREVLDPFNCSHSISQAWYNLDATRMRDLVARLGGASIPSPAFNLSIFD